MLRLTKKTEYGIIAMKYIISRQTTNRNGVISATEIAERFNIPRGILGKVLQQLARSELIESHQGVGGGYTLIKSPQKISLNEIVNAIEGPVSMVECIVEGEDECSPVTHS